MIRTALALLVLAASTSFAHANLPALPQTEVSANRVTDCRLEAQPAQCTDWRVSRGHADLAPRHVAVDATVAAA
ncbi:hypothetical protein SAMN05428969_3430 [Devosia sp. YR412]|uniref:hypothetical protein n=1 Tax=Devosia sp. YR412 TaxID=1881030 RepID=UPI0008AE0ACF|nr:hypothetical protein [Devosia sp. YR412]SEQ53770.1 hypothetical protein SAMN05428969_3430 [Devosia sp. YR412]